LLRWSDIFLFFFFNKVNVYREKFEQRVKSSQFPFVDILGCYRTDLNVKWGEILKAGRCHGDQGVKPGGRIDDPQTPILFTFPYQAPLWVFNHFFF
jgi:hypothetical protein